MVAAVHLPQAPAYTRAYERSWGDEVAVAAAAAAVAAAAAAAAAAVAFRARAHTQEKVFRFFARVRRKWKQRKAAMFLNRF